MRDYTDQESAARSIDRETQWVERKRGRMDRSGTRRNTCAFADYGSRSLREHDLRLVWRE